MDAIANVMPDMDDAAKSRRGERIRNIPRPRKGIESFSVFGGMVKS